MTCPCCKVTNEKFIKLFGISDYEYDYRLILVCPECGVLFTEVKQ